MSKVPFLTLALSGALAIATGCASNARYIRGTQVLDNTDNREILTTVDKYRQAVEQRDTATLLQMASRDYHEDGGTPTGADDYGYEGLREALATRFVRAEQIRYGMRYMRITVKEGRAFVDVIVDASYSVATDRGVSRLDMRDQNQLVLQRDGRRWVFVSGM
jgi:hypothetical protein